MPEATLDEFEATGSMARTIDQGVDEAEAVWAKLEALGITADDVSRVLEDEGVASFSKSFDELSTTLEGKASLLR
jgi:transaldolase